MKIVTLLDLLRRRVTLNKIINTLLAFVFIIVWIFPVYWMCVTAFSPRNEVLQSKPTLLPSHWSFEHMHDAFSSDSMLSYACNSLLVTVLSVVVAVIVAFLACAALTMHAFACRKLIMAAVIVVQMIPATAILIPQFIVFNRFGMLDTYVGLVLAYVTAVLPVAIWNLRGFFLAMPMSIFESARVEGASEWQILWRITFPLAAPGIIATSVFACIHAWNDYLIAYTFMKTQEKYTLPVWLASFATPSGVDVGAQMAASLIFSVPVIVFFLIIQHGLTFGSMQGAIK